MMHFTHKAGNSLKVEYNQFQCACTKPSTRGLRRGESGRRRMRRRWQQKVRTEPSHNKDGNNSIFVTDADSRKKEGSGGRRLKGEKKRWWRKVGRDREFALQLIDNKGMRLEKNEGEERKGTKRGTLSSCRQENPISRVSNLWQSFFYRKPFNLSFCWTFQFGHKEWLLIMLIQQTNIVRNGHWKYLEIFTLLKNIRTT